MSAREGNLGRALRAWAQILGPERVRSDEEARARAERTTFATRQRVLAVLSPGCVAELQQCLRVAQAENIRVYPSSQGKNWGYGSAVPVATQSVVLSLASWTRLSNFDAVLGSIDVEPGVTFSQLNDFLDARGAPFLLSPPGSTSAASVVGNLLERGTLPSANADLENPVLELEVVLPNGELLTTGRCAAAGGGSTPLGPDLRGLFVQSNLGVVTRVRVALDRIPSFFQSGVLRIRRREALPRVVDALRELKAAGLISPQAVLYNDFKILAMQRQYPTQLVEGQTPLPLDLLEDFRRSHGGLQWLGYFGLGAAAPELLAAQRRCVNERLAPLEIDVAYLPINHPQDPFYDRKVQRHATSLYWRKPLPIPADICPHRDRCGAIWCSALLPFRGSEIVDCVNCIAQLVYHHGFEPQLSLLAISSRQVHVIVGIFYDRDAEGHDALAQQCYDVTLAKLLERGYLPYRLGIQSMGVMGVAQDPGARRLLAALKSHVDPRRILAPGRYEALDASPKEETAGS